MEKRCGYGNCQSLGDDLKCVLLGLTGVVQKHKSGAELPAAVWQYPGVPSMAQKYTDMLIPITLWMLPAIPEPQSRA